MIVLLQGFSNLSWTHPIRTLLTQQLQNLLSCSGTSDLFGVADQGPQRRRSIKAESKLLLALDSTPGDKEQTFRLPALAFQDQRSIYRSGLPIESVSSSSSTSREPALRRWCTARIETR